MASSIKDIAKAAGISAASVSIYLNHPDTNRVSTETKKKIDYYVEKLHYRKNFLASGLSGKGGKIIGIIIPTVLDLFQNDFTNKLLSGVQNILKEKGFSMLFIPAPSSEDYNSVVNKQLQASGGCDAYVLFSTGFCTMEQVKGHIRSLVNSEKPFVTLNVPLLEQDVNQVVIPGLSSMTSLNYLYEMGHRRILLILGRPGGLHVRHYLEKYKQFLAEKKLPFDPSLILYGNYDVAETRKALSSFLGSGNTDINAICCGSDLMASAALATLKEKGFSVPGDISITGLDNSIYSELCIPGMTTVDLNIFEAGQKAGTMLLELLQSFEVSPGKQKCRTVLIPESLVERESVCRIYPQEGTNEN